MMRWGTTLLTLVLLGLSLWAIAHELQKYNYQDVLNSLANLPGDRFIFALIFTVLGYLTMTLYDVLALKYYLRHPLPYPQIVLASLISIAISNSVGFAVVTGSALRYRFYSAWGLSNWEIAQVLAFYHLGLWLGILAISGVLLLEKPLTLPQFISVPYDYIQALGIVLIALVLIYFILTIGQRRKIITIHQFQLRIIPPELALAQIILLILDWAFAAGVLFTLLSPLNGLTFSVFFKLFLLAEILGVVSNVPAGLGVFETAIIILLKPIVPGEIVLASLLAFRGFYFFLPLLIAVILFIWHELRHGVK
ncbi:MAG: UPF0104 family protein [Gomphosphaeria aponina SAG 52.96 = DSM 107014]|uniref:UPF0104 family protein n=1 Tax=Gomphosphaeria aponina SAG 52.96 = DSM 107014 TaxID=1521640 RepID=A0A941GMV9_9CHRO|nr:UPF0104 family protein [Gomphosphaeria aponina SAG 52.96 = DSM 107014]